MIFLLVRLYSGQGHLFGVECCFKSRLFCPSDQRLTSNTCTAGEDRSVNRETTEYFIQFLQTLGGPFSAVSTATIATKYSFFQDFRDLQDFHTFAPLRSQNFSKKVVTILSFLNNLD